MDIASLLIIWLVVAISLLIVSYIPFIGVEIDSFGKAMVAGAVFGVLNAIAQWFLTTFSLINFLTVGILGLIINVVIFALAAQLVEGFRLKHGMVSAALGAFFMAIVTSVVSHVVGLVL